MVFAARCRRPTGRSIDESEMATISLDAAAAESSKNGESYWVCTRDHVQTELGPHARSVVSGEITQSGKASPMGGAASRGPPRSGILPRNDESAENVSD